jgi:S1-C subfamily serine protease
MSKNIDKVFFLLAIYFFLTSCGANTTYNNKETVSKFPIESFVHIEATINIIKCIQIEGQSMCVSESHGSTASGVSIGQTNNSSLILTAGHLCEVDEEGLPQHTNSYTIEMKVFDYKGRASIGKILNTSPVEPDMCAILVKDHSIPGVKVATKTPKVGEVVYSMSAPLGIFHPPAIPILQGIYSGPRLEKDFSVVTIRAIGGCSGSAVLNEKMELVGILFATHPGFNSITLISTFELTKRFIFDTLLKASLIH